MLATHTTPPTSTWWGPLSMAEPDVCAPIDANGNLTTDGTRTFEWDARNQLVAVTVGTHRSEFTYDGLQRRVEEVEKENGVVQSDILVLWCARSICEERAMDGVTVTQRAFTHGEQVAGIAHYFTSDHLGSVRDVTDGEGASLARYTFDPWGRRTVAAGADITRTGFTGDRWHQAGALWLTQYRGLDSDIGRWVSEDPLPLLRRSTRELSAYSYVANMPITGRDPFGLCSCTDECPSGSWTVDVSLSFSFAFGAGVEGGEGVIRCKEKASVSRRAKVGCFLLGLIANLGVGSSVDVNHPTMSGPCNRSQLGPVHSTGWVGILGSATVSVSNGSVEGLGLGFGVGGGFAWADCLISPR